MSKGLFMKGYQKILYLKVTLLVVLLALGWTTYHFSQTHPLDKSFQLGILLSLAVLAGAVIVFFILSNILIPAISKHKSDHYGVHSSKPKRQPSPKRADHRTKQEAENPEIPNNQSEAQEEGSFAETILILPFDLSFLLAKESIENLSFGKVTEEESKAGMLVGSVGIGSSPQIIKLSIQPMTAHSTVVTISSKSSKKEQSEKKNAKYIAKISKFLKKKEKFYTE
jgi:cell division septation protein DedD